MYVHTRGQSWVLFLMFCAHLKLFFYFVYLSVCLHVHHVSDSMGLEFQADVSPDVNAES